MFQGEKRKQKNKRMSLMLAVIMLAVPLLGVMPVRTASAASDTADLRIMFTTDLHGQVVDVDYSKGTLFANGGLTKAPSDFPKSSFTISEIPAKSERSTKSSFCRICLHFFAPQKRSRLRYKQGRHLFALFDSCVLPPFYLLGTGKAILSQAITIQSQLPRSCQVSVSVQMWYQSVRCRLVLWIIECELPGI